MSRSDALFEYLRGHAEESLADTFIVATSRATSYGEFLASVEKRAKQLRTLHDRRRGQVHALVAHDTITTAEFVWAGIASGTSLALFDPQVPQDMVAASMAQLDGEEKPASEAGFFFRTSGTEGEPKFIFCSHRQVELAIQAMRENGCLQHAGDQHVLVTPSLAHSYGLSSFLEYSVCGSSVRLPSSRKALGPLMELGKSDPVPVSAVEGVPYFYEQLVRMSKRIDFSSIRHVGFGGGSVPAAAKTWLSKELPHVSVSVRYGMTETPSVVSQNFLTSAAVDDWDHAGIPLPILDVAVLQEDGRECDTGEDGELHIRGETVVVENVCDDDGVGWFQSGDIGYVDCKGRLHITGRKSAFLKRRGYRFSPEDIEQRMDAHPDIIESMILQVDSALVARIVPADTDVTRTQLLKGIAELVPDYAVPDSIEIVQSIPRTDSGKIKRQALSKGRL